MKKLFFTIVFLSVISFVGISKVKALPVGSTLDNWETNKVFAGQFYSNTGALLSFYSYAGYESAGFTCPYLDTGNANYGPVSCYNDRSFQFYNYSSFLVNSYPLCSQGDCTSTSGTVRNVVIILREEDYMQPGTTYHIEWQMGVKREWFEYLRNLLVSATDIQNNEGTVSNFDVVCYKSDAALVNNIFGRDYCSLSYDYNPSKLYPNVSFNLLTNTSLAEFNYNIEWLLYPKISVDTMSNFVKYEMKPNQKAFISGGSYVNGVVSGRVYMPFKYADYSFDYLSYFDLSSPFVKYENLIKGYNSTLNKDYIYYDYEFNYNLPNDLIMLSVDEWSIFDTKYPYDTIEFYVSPNTYVDIITPRYSPTNGLIMDFNYKNPITGQIVNHEHLGVSVPSDSSFFNNFTSVLDYFRGAILNVGVMFTTFYNYLISDLGKFFLFIFSFGILSAIIIMFR